MHRKRDAASPRRVGGCRGCRRSPAAGSSAARCSLRRGSPFRVAVGNGSACIRERLLALRDVSISSSDGATPTTPANGSPSTGMPGSSGERARAAGDLPRDEIGIREHVREEAESGNDGGDAEVGRLIGEELDVDDVARLCTFDVDGTRQRMAQPEVDVEHVGHASCRGELAVEPVARLQRDLVARPHRSHGLQIGMPAVVRPCGRDSHSSSATRSAALVAAAISSAVQVRGRPSWCKETTAFKRSPAKTGVTICAARPP